MATDDEYNSPGTAKPAKTQKAACGIRFEEDELQEGIDFSGAARLLTKRSKASSPSSADKHRKTQRKS